MQRCLRTRSLHRTIHSCSRGGAPTGSRPDGSARSASVRGTPAFLQLLKPKLAIVPVMASRA
ncbi:hypothetical protein CRV15_04345 [Streptomyces clavuligerus]|uniref:Uncharacterized protein n=1 Tax=Streptomyces clavuligerus TaxID=1901 RepID=B5GUV4_STRCL|nr:hypothetical protein D1794_04925 [Streptomyces clavuligerus]EDY50101.1 hypothetical protein SSCG_03089 [Streptomyces clavuligerus]EFG09909.1 Hypothetical protein SCLAV_4836 [Streptomyces clavuligerus]QCS04909.1 hypothetical protein CRV15_04345 [Streptomyces clavuligerus]QPJ95720.1 hypothetical protein GE265_23555 [Streptomyces clavuligerus]